MKLTSLQDKACWSLKEALAGPSSGSEDGMCIFQDADVELDDNELNDKDDEEYENLEEDKQESEEVLLIFIHNPMQCCILNLLVKYSHIFLQTQTISLSFGFLSFIHANRMGSGFLDAKLHNCSLHYYSVISKS